MEKIITEIAKKLGIDVIGVTSILDYSYLYDFLQNRKEKGFESELEEADIKKRLDARNIFPQCKSIIAIGVPYAAGYKKPSANNVGLLSVVSYGEDYHVKVKNLLENLAAEIKKYVDFNYEACVDTSPLIDREICKNAGIGQYGKNSMLINEKYGSFINLGYLLTDLEIRCETKETHDLCGQCDICIKSCPNNAILKDGGINSSKCVSNLTQTKKDIPYDYRNNMKNQIYGCDVCQLVCPKNKMVLRKDVLNDYSVLAINLEELLCISNAEFAKKYGNLSGSWRGKNIWKRNALIAIGNLKMTSMFELVKKELENPSDMIKIYAAWTLMQLDRKKASDILNNSLKYENDIINSEFMKLLEVYHDNRNL